MIVLITGASHTGKTLLAQHMLERFGYPYLSIGDDSLPSQLESERCRGVQLVFTRFRPSCEGDRSSYRPCPWYSSQPISQPPEMDSSCASVSLMPSSLASASTSSGVLQAFTFSFCCVVRPSKFIAASCG